MTTVLDSPLVTLLALVLGVGAGAWLLRGLIPAANPQAAWCVAATLVAVVAVAASVPTLLRNRVTDLDAQRTANAGTTEAAGSARCAIDQSRQDLIPGFAFARAQIPANARFLLVPPNTLPCTTLNLLPRLPVNSSTFDPQRDWIIYDRPDAKVTRLVDRDRRKPEAQRHYLSDNVTTVVARPGTGLVQ